MHMYRQVQHPKCCQQLDSRGSMVPIEAAALAITGLMGLRPSSRACVSSLNRSLHL